MATELPAQAEVVVIGAGHNSMVCAGYLAKAGLDVLVLEANDQPGGNTRTEQLTLPGFAHDSCSSAHVLVQNNPLIRDDELGLMSEWGLRYLTTDPAVVMPQQDGDLLVVHPDLDATCAEIARWSEPDAAAFRTLVEEWRGGLAQAHGRWSSHLPQPDDDAHPALPGAARAVGVGRGARALRASGRPLVHDVDGDGHHPGPASAGHRFPAVVAGHRAHRLRLDHTGRWQPGPARCAGRAGREARRAGGLRGPGVRDRSRARRRTPGADRGRSLGRRVGRAVVAGGHLSRLPGMLEGVEPTADLLEAQEAWRPGLSVFAVHAAIRGDLGFGSGDRRVTSAAAGYGTSEGFARHLDKHHRGELETEDPWLLVVNQTAVDPSRAPDGAGTFKILTIAPYELADGRDWADVKDDYAATLIDLVRRHCTGLEPGDILALRAESPVDVAAHNPQNLGGSCHGGEFLIDGAGGAGLAALRHRRAGAVPHRSDRAPGRLGLGTARPQRRPSGADVARARPARGDGPGLSCRCFLKGCR